MVMTNTHVKDEGDSVQKIEWKQTQRQTDGADCITFRATDKRTDARLTHRLRHVLLALEVSSVYIERIDAAYMLIQCKGVAFRLPHHWLACSLERASVGGPLVASSAGQ